MSKTINWRFLTEEPEQPQEAGTMTDDDLMVMLLETKGYTIYGPGEMEGYRVVRMGRARTNDHATSKKGAEDVTRRAGSQVHKLLKVYASNDGLTDEEAAAKAGLSHVCYWKRCGEMRQDGLIRPTRELRKGDAGIERMVCAITRTGWVALDKMNTQENA